MHCQRYAHGNSLAEQHFPSVQSATKVFRALAQTEIVFSNLTNRDHTIQTPALYVLMYLRNKMCAKAYTKTPNAHMPAMTPKPSRYLG